MAAKATFTAAAVMLALTVAGMMTEVSGETYRVGGKNGWIPTTNMTEWANDKHFYVNDWLLFVYDAKYANVLEVTEASYDKCGRDEHGVLHNFTSSGRDEIQLKAAKRYYFVTSGPGCERGMKLSVLVNEHPSSIAPSTSKKNDSTSSEGSFLLRFGCFVVGILVMFLY